MMKNILASKWKVAHKFGVGAAVFSQGDQADTVMYIQEGAVKLTVVNESGKEAVTAILGPGDLLGESCLAGLSDCKETAIAIAPTILLVIEKGEMARLLHMDHDFSGHFIAYLLAQKVRIEEDLADQLLNSSEKRLAHILLRLAHCEAPGNSQKVLPNLSQRGARGDDWHNQVASKLFHEQIQRTRLHRIWQWSLRSACEQVTAARRPGKLSNQTLHDLSLMEHLDQEWVTEITVEQAPINLRRGR